ncbi:hypothetical protein EZV62_013235 [Acer yangbiense]|uniref:EF-hand domain-containing protein n=1 Tax=Acer yangbiense TaxID=1000413 RepID=A0A5C7I0F2_9ROSI|nr:hypothetical protein EZV62_013235 [Acer yangbiense]
MKKIADDTYIAKRRHDWRRQMLVSNMESESPGLPGCSCVITMLWFTVITVHALLGCILLDGVTVNNKREDGDISLVIGMELKRVFATFDKNGDGFITKQELRESLKNLRLMVTEKEAEEMVVKVDANGDGLIDFDEFRILYKAMIAQDYDDDDGDDRSVDGGEEVGNGGEEDLKDAFDVFDKDKDGLISVEELGLVLSSLGLNEGKKIENCREMIRKVDMDGDGMVNFVEFKKMMKSGGKLLTAS